MCGNNMFVDPMAIEILAKYKTDKLECSVKPTRKFELEGLEKQLESMSRWLGKEFKESTKDIEFLYQVPMDTTVCTNCQYTIKYGCDLYCTNDLGKIE